MSSLIHHVDVLSSKMNSNKETRAMFGELLKGTFFAGVDFSKVDTLKLIHSLQEDALRCERLGIDPEPSDETFLNAGLSKGEFLLMTEKAAANLNSKSERGEESRRKLELFTHSLGRDLEEVSAHMVDLSNKLNRSTITKLSKQWNVDLDHYKCVNCSKQQKDCDSKLLKCGNCGDVYYCSKACQKEHWRGGHRETCVRYVQGESEVEEVGKYVEGGKVEEGGGP